MNQRFPQEDATPLLTDLRSSALSQLLVAGTTRFDIGTQLQAGPQSYDVLRKSWGLADRAATVLLTGLRAMNLIDVTSTGDVELTSYGREKLAPDSSYNLRGYVGLGTFSADTQNMIACLERNSPAGEISFVYHENSGPSALDHPETSDALTRAMAARARNVAPFVAQRLDLSDCKHVIDVGGGHGIYALELLKQFPQLSATILDREPPLKVAKEYAEQAGLSDRVKFVFADIHNYQLPQPADAILLANILHDYSEDHAQQLVKHYGKQLETDGLMIILDAFLESVPPTSPPISRGPKAVAAYSAMLFSICEGRCYRLDEYQQMLLAAQLSPQPKVESVPANGSLLIGSKTSNTNRSTQ
ncbi:MAG: methyltransferase [Pirellulaceae bacterium]|nr:methyltransferase [Pirellulaceae bacterium]